MFKMFLFNIHILKIIINKYIILYISVKILYLKFKKIDQMLIYMRQKSKNNIYYQFLDIYQYILVYNNIKNII